MAKRPVPLYDFAAFGQAIKYDISVDQFFFMDKAAEKSTQRRQLDTLLDSMSDKGMRIVTAKAKEIAEVENKIE